MKQDNELGLRISAKYNRIYIHRTTLKAMGDPAFVSLGIHPQSKKLVVLAAREATADALRVRCWEDNSPRPKQKTVSVQFLHWSASMTNMDRLFWTERSVWQRQHGREKTTPSLATS